MLSRSTFLFVHPQRSRILEESTTDLHFHTFD